MKRYSAEYIVLLVIVAFISGSVGFFLSSYYYKVKTPISSKEKQKPKDQQPLVDKKTFLKKIDSDNWPEIKDSGDLTTLAHAVNASRKFLSKLPSQKKLSFGDAQISASVIKASVDAFYHLMKIHSSSPELFTKEIKHIFDIYQAYENDNTYKNTSLLPQTVLVTGYFQPIIKASKSADGVFSYPLYPRPEDLIQARLSTLGPGLPDITVWGRVYNGRMVPYYSRHEIDYGNSSMPQAPMAWLSSPIDGLMLHIQGSGILQFPDKTKKFIHYTASNGRAYGSIGKWLIKKGYIKSEDTDWPSIRRWCEKNPEKFAEAARANPRYIFFQWEKEGPIGSMGAMLQPKRSVALDQSIYPTGSLCFLKFQLHEKEKKNFSGFVLNQDKGSAIQGNHRIDLYCGEGKEAGRLAGSLKNQGELYVLLLKTEYQ